METTGGPASEYDVFVSYAHADDEVPAGAARGWVTTLAAELNKVLRRKIGGQGARIWMDHQLAANAGVSATLRDAVRASRTLLLVMSPGYLASEWARGELGVFLAEAGHDKSKDNVFLVEIEQVTRDDWHAALQALTAVRFWHKEFDDIATRLLGFPVPKADEDNPYWHRVNDLAHQIAAYLRTRSTAPAASRPVVVLAETTEDLLDQRDSLVASLQQHDVETVPGADYPRESEASFLGAVRRDLGRAALFVQLFGPFEGRKPAGGEASFVALQAREAAARAGLRTLAWRAPDVQPEQVASPAYRQLLASCQTGGFEAFKAEALRAIERSPAPATAPAATRVPASPAAVNAVADQLQIYVLADGVDHEWAGKAGKSLESLGVDALVASPPDPGRPPEQIRRAQEDALAECDGALLVYGRTPTEWVEAQFAIVNKVFGKRTRGVWGALLQVEPDRPDPGVPQRRVMRVDFGERFDPARLAEFLGALRGETGGARG